MVVDSKTREEKYLAFADENHFLDFGLMLLIVLSVDLKVVCPAYYD